MKRLRWLSVILLLLLSSSLQHQEPAPPLPAGMPRPKIQTPRSASALSPRYSYRELASRTQADRERISSCFLMNPGFDSNQVIADFSWPGSGLVRIQALKPDPGDSVRSCMEGVVLSWALAPPAGQKPFRYRVVFRL